MAKAYKPNGHESQEKAARKGKKKIPAREEETYVPHWPRILAMTGTSCGKPRRLMKNPQALSF
jgi:hypothetical protein